VEHAVVVVLEPAVARAVKMDLVAGLVIVERRSSRLKNKSRLLPHLTTTLHHT